MHGSIGTNGRTDSPNFTEPSDLAATVARVERDLRRAGLAGVLDAARRPGGDDEAVRAAIRARHRPAAGER